MKDSTKIISFFVSFIKPKNYLEIGINKCETLNEVSKYSKFCYGVDPNSNCINFIDKSQKNIFFLNTTSDNFFRSNKKTYNVIFIDGLHTFKQVKKDLSNSFLCLNKGGWIFLHDTYPPNKEHLKSNLCGDVFKILPTLKESVNLNFEILTLPWAYGITIIHEMTTQNEHFKNLIC